MWPSSSVTVTTVVVAILQFNVVNSPSIVECGITSQINDVRVILICDFFSSYFRISDYKK